MYLTACSYFSLKYLPHTNLSGDNPTITSLFRTI